MNSLSRRAAHALCTAVLAILGLTWSPEEIQAQPWNLTVAQRQAYLNYYAPVILKRGDENDGKNGRDWLTNFDFDRDGNFSNNRLNWLNVPQYLAAAQSGSGAYSNWRIRPTLYSALIEYMNGGSKSLVLLYHVYNAADKDGNQIHDWERVEIVLHGVSGTPGGGRRVRQPRHGHAPQGAHHAPLLRLGAQLHADGNGQARAALAGRRERLGPP